MATSDGENERPPDPNEGPKKIDPTREGEKPPESGETDLFDTLHARMLAAATTPQGPSSTTDDSSSQDPLTEESSPSFIDATSPSPDESEGSGEDERLEESNDSDISEDSENALQPIPIQRDPNDSEHPLPIHSGSSPPWSAARSYSDRGHGTKTESEDSEIDWEDVKRSEKQWEALGAAEVLAHRRKHKREELHITVVVGELKKLPQQSAVQQSEDSELLTGCLLSFSSLVLVSSVLLCLGIGATTFAVAVGFGSRALYEDPKMRERFFEDVSTLVDHVTPQQTPESIPDAGKPNHQKQVGSP